MKKIIVFASLLAAPSGTPVESRASGEPTGQQDPRSIQLSKFFQYYDCPLSRFTADFIREADLNDLDWRLLPSISVVESSGGKHSINNNVFGWNSCRTRFPSVRAGIHVVAAKLGKSSLYRDKEVDEILRTYNPHPGYALRVEAMMSAIGPLIPEIARLN